MYPTITVAQVRAAIETLGVEYKDVAELIITPDEVRVISHLRHENGDRMFRDGGVVCFAQSFAVDWGNE